MGCVHVQIIGDRLVWIARNRSISRNQFSVTWLNFLLDRGGILDCTAFNINMEYNLIVQI